MINMETVSITLDFEPVNRRDNDAILVHACPGDSLNPTGYIPGMKVPKVTQTIKKNETTSMSLRAVKYQYVFSISSCNNLQGEDVTDDFDLLNEEFITIIQTPFQKATDQQFSSKGVRIGSTHSTTGYDFLLTTLMVTDEC